MKHIAEISLGAQGLHAQAGRQGQLVRDLGVLHLGPPLVAESGGSGSRGTQWPGAMCGQGQFASVINVEADAAQGHAKDA